MSFIRKFTAQGEGRQGLLFILLHCFDVFSFTEYRITADPDIKETPRSPNGRAGCFFLHVMLCSIQIIAKLFVQVNKKGLGFVRVQPGSPRWIRTILDSRSTYLSCNVRKALNLKIGGFRVL